MTRVKVFFATNAESLSDHNFYRQVRVAIKSAVEVGHCDAFLMVDGDCTEWASELRGLGAQLLPVACSIEQSLVDWMRERNYDDVNIRCRRGSYLRMELPQVVSACEIEAECVLYSDVDVFFRRPISQGMINTSTLRAVGERPGRGIRRLFASRDCQAGVLAMNIPFMRAHYNAFRAFVLENGGGTTRPPQPFYQKHLFMSDQVAINLYFRKHLQRLSADLNHTPHLGPRRSARIIHFSGLKWTDLAAYMQGDMSPARTSKFDKQMRRHFEYYKSACEEALTYESRILP